MASDAEIEAAARKLAGQYMVDDGYGESSRANAETGLMWRNFKTAAALALAAAEQIRQRDDALQSIADVDPTGGISQDERAARREAAYRPSES